jgi:hypothetical protein
LPWLGFVPDEVTAAPPVAVTRLAERLAIDPGELQGYGRQEQTRTGHLQSAARYLGWKQAPPGDAAMKELEQFLLDRAMEHDSPTLLFNLAAEYLISAKVIRPGVVTLMEMVGAARAGAGELTFEQVAHLLTGQMRSDLDRLLQFDAGLGMARLAGLVKPADEVVRHRPGRLAAAAPRHTGSEPAAVTGVERPLLMIRAVKLT